MASSLASRTPASAVSARHLRRAAVLWLASLCSRQAARSAFNHCSACFRKVAFASLVFPFAPHLGSEVYETLTGARVWEEPWPTADPDMLVRPTFMLVCQVNGKVRDRVEAPTGAPREELEKLALAAQGVQAHLNGHQVVKVVVVPDRLVNIVVKA